MEKKIAFNVFFNQGEYISDSIRNLETTGLWGGLFAAMVLLFFLRTLRMTAIITLSIPLCVMITIYGTLFSRLVAQCPDHDGPDGRRGDGGR